ncbi:uncharacterized protein LOC143279722 isoform X2 [Babylonia areolata]|uniref:uncharacterized protein LOC143279722 isoform X2 n=2 Tax=Babylonia areolata TaxID=304850 RepID=UPI003FD20FCA
MCIFENFNAQSVAFYQIIFQLCGYCSETRSRKITTDQSEVTELDYQANQALTTRDAPFGTEDTPTLKNKIVGGKHVSVLERPYGQHTPRYEKLSIVSDKPNHVDPRALTDFARRYNKPYLFETHGMVTDHNQLVQDPFSKSKVVGRPTNLISRRPDSKDISSRYPHLPPIEGNRLKNSQISTVFEPEPWTRQFNSENGRTSPRRPFNSSEADRSNGFRPLYDPKEPGAKRSMQSPPAVNGMRRSFDGDVAVKVQEAPLTRTELVKKLTSSLSDYPIQVAEADEVRLLEVIAEEMGQHSPLKLRDIYLDIATTHDKSLSGYCQYQDLNDCMNRQMFSMPGDLLQLTAGMFVSTDRHSREVNYEKFLSFLGLALKYASKNRPPEDTHRSRSPVSQQVDNYFTNSEHAKLVSTVEQQLSENDFTIDISRLETDMLRADRMGKNLLDLRTIMDVCYQQNIPLQKSVLTRVLQRCRFSNHDDLYNWRQFVDFLGKANQGKPRTEPVRFKPVSPPPAQRRYTPASPVNSRPLTPLWRRHEPPPQDPRVPFSYEGHREEQHSRQEQVISRLEQDIRQLERNYGDIKDKLRPKNDTPWFKNFMEFANALYNQDQRFEGDLPAEDVYRWTRMYNESGNLGFSDHNISKALSDASKGGKVNIHTYLAKLGNVANHEKIV